jgi:hypothetical protein
MAKACARRNCVSGATPRPSPLRPPSRSRRLPAYIILLVSSAAIHRLSLSRLMADAGPRLGERIGVALLNQIGTLNSFAKPIRTFGSPALPNWSLFFCAFCAFLRLFFVS